MLLCNFGLEQSPAVHTISDRRRTLHRKSDKKPHTICKHCTTEKVPGYIIQPWCSWQQSLTCGDWRQTHLRCAVLHPFKYECMSRQAYMPLQSSRTLQHNSFAYVTVLIIFPKTLCFLGAFLPPPTLPLQSLPSLAACCDADAACPVPACKPDGDQTAKQTDDNEKMNEKMKELTSRSMSRLKIIPQFQDLTPLSHASLAVLRTEKHTNCTCRHASTLITSGSHQHPPAQ